MSNIAVPYFFLPNEFGCMAVCHPCRGRKARICVRDWYDRLVGNGGSVRTVVEMRRVRQRAAAWRGGSSFSLVQLD